MTAGVAVTAEISLRSPQNYIYFNYQILYILDQSIEKTIKLILKKTSLVIASE